VLGVERKRVDEAIATVELGVDQRLIAYFFGSKQRLFIAAVGLPFNPAEVLPAVLGGDRDSTGDRLAALLVDVLEQPELHQRLTGVVRAAASEPEVARMLREFLARELFERAAEMLGSDDGPFRANLVGSQIVGLVMTRYVVQIEPLASMPPRAVAAAIAPTLQRYLLGPLSPDDR
jgi:AcrR family transcriptional regulator